jgi:hypothetical protein
MATDSSANDYVTVFRSAEPDRYDEARRVRATLEAAGLDVVFASDDEPGVVAGTCEVRVASVQQMEAEAILAETRPDETPADPSSDLDLVTVASTDGATGELQANAIKSILDAYGVQSVIVGSTTLPNLGFEVRVPQDHEVQARQAIAEAEAAGPQAALQAEQESERTALS